MTTTIAVAGKGGTGKTTLCSLMVQYLCAKKAGAVLAVDADANSNLNEALGVDATLTLGEIREEIARADMMEPSPIPVGMTKPEYAEYKFNSALLETDDYDLLVMGRTQGQGCYCYVNGVLKSQIERFSGNYRYVLVDNEAGMEHISRGILPRIDALILVSDCSRRGIEAVGRIARLSGELKLTPIATGLIVNRAPEGGLNPGIAEEIKNQGLTLLGVTPLDQAVYECDCEGKPITSIPDDSPVRKALYSILDGLAL